MAASYRSAVHWIAWNDAPGDEATVEELGGYISVILVADLFGKDQEKVAADVYKFRMKHHDAIYGAGR